MRNGFLCLLVVLPLTTGCYQSHTPGDVDRVDAGPPTCITVEVDDAGTITAEEVDLLIMMDNSNSMREEQLSLIGALPELVRALSSGDVDFDGVEDFTPVGSLHLGVVTADMGTGGFVVPTCARADFGDDGVLRTQGNTDVSGCAATYPSFLEFEPGAGTSPETFAAESGCLLAAGIEGCGFEQQLEAVLKALTPSSSSIRFFRNTTGHGDGSNAGFLRPDSVLVVLVVTDENDCSARDPELFNPSSATYGSTDLNLRCAVHLDALHPVARYADGLISLRAGDPGRLVYATITGIPIHLGSSDASTILADPEMEERIDPSEPTRLRASCVEPGGGVAFPPRRIIETGGAIAARGGRSIHQSICQSDFSPAVSLILTEVGRAIRPRCR